MPPKYLEIATALRAEIAAGTYPADSRLPSERALIEQFGAAQGTVRKALALLQHEGLVEARQGAGVFVRSRFEPILRNAVRRLSHDQWGHGKSIWAVDVDTRQMDVDRVRVFRADAPEHIARALGAADVWVRDRRYLVEGRPVMLATSYLPAEIVAGSLITQVDPGEGGTYARLLELGFKPEQFREEVRAYMPAADIATALDLRPGQPVIEIARTARTADDRVVEINEMVLDARAYVLQYDFTS